MKKLILMFLTISLLVSVSACSCPPKGQGDIHIPPRQIPEPIPQQRNDEFKKVYPDVWYALGKQLQEAEAYIDRLVDTIRKHNDE